MPVTAKQIELQSSSRISPFRQYHQIYAHSPTLRPQDSGENISYIYIWIEAVVNISNGARHYGAHRWPIGLDVSTADGDPAQVWEEAWLPKLLREQVVQDFEVLQHRSDGQQRH